MKLSATVKGNRDGAAVDVQVSVDAAGELEVFVPTGRPRSNAVRFTVDRQEFDEAEAALVAAVMPPTPQRPTPGNGRTRRRPGATSPAPAKDAAEG